MDLSETSLFLPSRIFGQVCSEVKPCYVPLVDQALQGILWCTIDNNVCGYALDRLRLLFSSSPLHSTVKLLAADKKHVYAATENTISILSDKAQGFLRNISTNSPKLLLPFGDFLVVINGANKIEIFEVDSGDMITEIEASESFEITTVCHPITYLNQIVLGARDGRMKIMDLEAGKLVREFPVDKNFNCAITVLEQSPAVDVLGVGLEDGRIHLRNIKMDRIICTFRQDASITSLSFRTDGIDSLISGSSEGSIAVWDLNERILVGQKTDMHRGPITSLVFLLGQAFVVSSGDDNRIVKWVLKDENSLPEQRQVLEGPSEPVCSISFNGPESLLVASKDGCLRKCLLNSRQMKRLGVGREVKKSDISFDRFIDVRLNPIIQMSANSSREAVWNNIICQHENSCLVSTWSSRRETQGSHLLYHKRFKDNPKYVSAYATSIFLSYCGTFAIVGYSTGHLDVFNMQSGKHKQSFFYKPLSNKVKNEDDFRAHTSAVTGIVLDMKNRNLVSGSNDRSIHFWSLNPPKLLSRIVVPSGITKFRMDRYNSLLSIALENGEIVIADILCRRVARHLKNAHKGTKITALEFSPDGKWLISADTSGILKVWDLTTSKLIDLMKLTIPCVDVSFNSTGQYIATCHEGMRAVYLWANKSFFVSNFSIADYESKADVPIRECTLPTLAASMNHDEIPANGDESDIEAENCRFVVIDDDEFDNGISESFTKSIEGIFSKEKTQIEQQLVTLSGLPPTRWANLPNLDLIRQRNKPIEPPKKPAHAPFFLPTTETLDGFVFENIVTDEMEKENVIKADKVLAAKRKLDELETPWARLLTSSANDPNELTAAFNMLKQMNVSAIDFQIRALSTRAFIPFFNMIVVMLNSRQDFELVQSYLSTFFNIHREALWGNAPSNIKEEDEKAESEGETNKPNEDASIKIALEEVLKLHNETWTEVQQLMDCNMSLAQWIKCALF